MRSRQEILSDTLDTREKVPEWDATASLHERLTIEVLVDIRDILRAHVTTSIQISEAMAEAAKGGDIDEGKDR